MLNKQWHPLQLGTSDFGHLKIYTWLDDLLVWEGKSRSVASDELTLYLQSLPLLEHMFRIKLLSESDITSPLTRQLIIGNFSVS